MHLIGPIFFRYCENESFYKHNILRMWMQIDIIMACFKNNFWSTSYFLIAFAEIDFC